MTTITLQIAHDSETLAKHNLRTFIKAATNIITPTEGCLENVLTPYTLLYIVQVNKLDYREKIAVEVLAESIFKDDTAFKNLRVTFH